MFDENDFIFLFTGALLGFLIGFWVRDRQSQQQKIRWRRRKRG
jgi:hypothetical protein